jgi:hypothetical protein
MRRKKKEVFDDIIRFYSAGVIHFSAMPAPAAMSFITPAATKRACR